MPAAMTSIAQATLTSAAPSITFGGLPSSYRDLRLIVQYKATDNGIQALFQVNGDTGSNYSRIGMSSYSTSSTGSWTTTSTSVKAINYTGVSNTEFCVLIVDILDYAQTDKHKTMLIRSTHTGEVDVVAARWASTSAITSILIAPETNTFQSGTTFELFGIAG